LNIADSIATSLNETEETPVRTIERIVKVLGEERALALANEAIKISTADGGMQTDDGERRRTLGGIFFKLTKNQATSRERWFIFNSTGPVKPTPKIKPISWQECEQLSTEAINATKGEISTVKITLIGQPGRIIEKETVVITAMRSSKAPSLPKWLPQPLGDPTTYVVYIAMKQWRKVKDSLEHNPDDKLIVEGYPAFDKRIGQTGAMTVYCQSATTKLIQQAQREK
jgi:hypothetical protein